MKIKVEKDCEANPSPIRLLRVKDEECSQSNSPCKNYASQSPIKQKNVKFKKPRVSKAQKAGINFPVGQIIKSLRDPNSKSFFSEESCVMLAGVVEFLTAALLDSALDMTKLVNQRRILPKHIYLAVKTNRDLSYLFGNILIPYNGELVQAWLSLLNE